MKRLQSNWLVILGLAAAAISAGAIIQAVIPQVVPTANKIGNSTKFQLGIAGAISGDCASFDANLNVTGPGTGAGCAGAASNSGGITVYSGTAGISLSGTTFFPIGGGSGASTTETAVDADVQATITWSHFGVSISTALGMGNSAVFTWRKNASSQTLTCTISGAVATTCGDSTNSFSSVPGDLIAVQSVFSGTIVVAPTFVMTAQVGSILSGSVNAGTQYQIAEYLTTGSAVTGVTIVPCVDTGGNHLNVSATGVFSCGTTSSGGSALAPWNPAASTPPTLSNWTQVNGGGNGTFADTTNAVAIDSVSGNNVKALWVAQPGTQGTAFTMTGLIQAACYGGNAASWGLMVGDTGNKMVMWAFQKASSTGLNMTSLVNNFTDSTTYSSTPFQSSALVPVKDYWLRVQYDATNLIFSTSPTGVLFQTQTTIAENAFLASTPRKIGFMASSQTTAVDCTAILVYWLVTQP